MSPARDLASGPVLGALTGFRVGVAAGDDPDAPDPAAAVEELVALLAGHGAEVLVAPVAPAPAGTRPAPELFRMAAERRLQVLVPVGDEAVRRVAHSTRLARVLADGDMVAAALDDRGSAALAALGAEPVAATGEGAAGLVAGLCRQAGQVLTRVVATPAGDVELRGTGFVHQGRFHALPDAQAALVRTLAARSGAVVSRAELVRRLPGLASEHALEMVVCRVRTALPAPLVATVPRRGYRLAV